MTARFRYAAVDGAGATRRGVVAAASAAEAAALLRRAALAPVAIRPTTAAAGRRAPLADRAAAMRRLAALAAARAPLDRALRLAGSGSKAAALFEDLALAVAGGRRLSDAMADWPEDFPPALRAVTAAGERSGALAAALDAAAASLERAAAGRRAAVSALAYPAFLTIAALAALAVFAGFAAPRFEAVVRASGRPPSGSTEALFAAMGWVRLVGLPALLLALGLGAVAAAAAARPAGRRRLAEIGLGLPLIGPLLRDRAAEAWAAAMGAMLTGGAPAAEAAALAAPAFGAASMEAAGARAAAAMAEGRFLSAALRAEPALPPDLAAFAEIGEETGALGPLMERAAAHFAAEAEARARRLGALAGPTLTAALGLLIGLGAYVMMTAVIDVYDAAL